MLEWAFTFFLQLPYLIDGETKLTQSTAILFHLAQKHDLRKFALKILSEVRDNV